MQQQLPQQQQASKHMLLLLKHRLLDSLRELQETHEPLQQKQQHLVYQQQQQHLLRPLLHQQHLLH